MYACRSAFGLFAFIVPRYLTLRAQELAARGKQFGGETAGNREGGASAKARIALSARFGC